MQSFERAYGQLKGDVKLASNSFVEATFNIKSLAQELKAPDFSLGGFLETYRRGTDTINEQKFQETHAWRFTKVDGQVSMQYLTRRDFICGKRLSKERDWETNASVDILKECVTKEMLLGKLRQLQPGGWRTVQAGDSEGWVGLEKSKSEVLNYARRHTDKFSSDALTELEAYFTRVPKSFAQFAESLNSMQIQNFDRLTAYCTSATENRQERSQAIDQAIATMSSQQGQDTVPNVRHNGFTVAQRRAALQEAKSNAEYSTTEPVKVGEYIFASAEDLNPDYKLPLSFGLVYRIVDMEGEPVDESVDEDDVLTVGWFAPMTNNIVKHRYGGKWEMIKAAEGADTLNYRSDIERGSVVLASIEESKLVAKNYIQGGRVLINFAFGRPLLRKLKELPTSVTKWDLYGVIGI